jgi:hypothetical protein
MQLLMRANGQQMAIDMDRAGDQTLSVGEYRYRPARMARKVRRLASSMWGAQMAPEILNHRLTFEALDRQGVGNQWSDSGSFSPRSGSVVLLGRWDEDGSVGIALHELAHEMHLRHGGYDHSDGVVREALSLLAEREAGLIRNFEREPYYTSSNLIEQLSELHAFARQPFSKRWGELCEIVSDAGISDLITYYLDRSYRLGLETWLKRYGNNVELREALMNKLAVTTLRYSLEYRQQIIRQLVRCRPEMSPDQVVYLLDAIATLDRRYPQDDLGRIIDFCFAPHIRKRRRLLAFGS